MPTKNELKKLAADNKLTVKGTKKELEDRLKAAGIDIPESTTKVTGVGSRAVTPKTMDQTAALKKGSALLATAHVMFSGNELDAVTVRCLAVLKCYIMAPRQAPKQASPPVDAAMQPVLEFCEALVGHTDSMVVEDSPGANYRALRTRMTIDVNQIINDYPVEVTHPAVAQLLRFFLTDGSVTSAVAVAYPSGATDEEDDEQYQQDLNRAIEESLKDVRKKAEDVLDQYQREMQEYYAGQGGTDIDVAESTADIPMPETLVKAVPKTGISFAELARKFKIHGHDEEILVELQTELLKRTRLQGNKLYPIPAGERQKLVPDEDIRYAVASYGNDGADFYDLIKVLRIREQGVEAVTKFRQDILRRRLVQENDFGRLVLVKNSQHAATTGNTAGDRAKERSAETATASAETAAATEAPKKDEESLIARVDITKQVERVRHAILAHLRNWTEDFPRPALGSFPADFDNGEKKKIRGHVTAYLVLNDLYGKPDDQTLQATITHFLNDATFPVARAKHRAAIQAAVKEQYSDAAKRKKRKKKAAQQAAAARQAAEDDGSDSDDDQAGEGAAGSDQESSGGDEGKRRGRSRRRTVSPGVGREPLSDPMAELTMDEADEEMQDS